jgi:predicted DCC family thiol-disulfide oxidoreductase YuxK
MKSLGEKWNAFWFEPSTADNLALARILVYGSMSLFYLFTPYLFASWGWHATFSEWGDVAHVFWRPIWLFRTLHLPQLGVNEITAIDAVWKLSLILSAVGLFTRISTTTSFILSVYLFGLANNFGKTHHLDILLLWTFLIMSVSRCGDAWSIDRLIRTARTGSDSLGKRPVASGEYTWPIRLIWVVMCTIYFEAGFSKVRHSGIAWITGGMMTFFLQRAQYHVTDAEPITNWGLIIARHDWSSELFALMGMGLELSYPLALFGRRLRWIFVPSGMLMQIGIAILMGPNFYQMIICQFLWLPLDRVVYWIADRLAIKNKYAVVFDGSCGLCKRTIAVVRSVDLLKGVEYFDAVNQWPQVERRFPSLDRGRCLDDMHAVSPTGQVLVGFDAYRGLIWVLPLGWLLLPIFYFPGARLVGSRIYRAVADHRHNGSCALPSATEIQA